METPANRNCTMCRGVVGWEEKGPGCPGSEQGEGPMMVQKGSDRPTMAAWLGGPHVEEDGAAAKTATTGCSCYPKLKWPHPQ